MQNPYPWPKIPNVAQAIDGRVKKLLSSLDIAADVIAKAWRHFYARQHENSRDLWMEVFRAFQGKRKAGHIQTSREFHDYFTKHQWVASQKYDGTNVGVTEDQLILGRRLIVSSDAPKYQGTSLDEVKATLPKVPQVKAALFQKLKNTDADRFHCTVYGELMCNGGRFDYLDRQLNGTYACFGIILRCTQAPSENLSQNVAAELADQGFKVAVGCNNEYEAETSDDPQQYRVKIMMCPALRALLESYNIRVVAPAVQASMVEVVRKMQPWMMDGLGEGVVLTMTNGTENGLSKWKTATEGQGGTPDVLRCAVEQLQSRGQHLSSTAKSTAGNVQIVDSDIVDTVKIMHEVSISDCKGQSAKAVAARQRAKKNKKKAPKAPAAALLDEDDVRAAYDSALTKYDDLQAWFSSGASMKQVSSTIVNEMLTDFGCRDQDAPARTEAEDGGCAYAFGKVKSFQKCGCPECKKQLGKQACVRKYVMKSVGFAFGSWKKAGAKGL